jgi:hypothetical protein
VFWLWRVENRPNLKPRILARRDMLKDGQATVAGASFIRALRMLKTAMEV